MMFVLTSVVKVLFIISTFRIMTFILQKVIFTNYILFKEAETKIEKLIVCAML